MPAFEFEVDARLDGERLDRAVARQARDRGFDLSNSKAKRLVEDGGVFVDGREAWKASRSLKAGWRVKVVLPDAVANPSPLERVDLGDRILFADEWLIAIDKPPGLPTHATHDPDRDHARAAVERWLEEQGDDPVYVGVHHRLDVGTSGVLVFTRSKAANKGLADAFSEREVVKSYVALVTVDAELPQQWEVENHLGRDRHSNAMLSVHSGGDYARTTFRTVQTVEGAALVEATPHTGRRHQIRVHLAEGGTPILGDETYGGPVHVGGAGVDRVMLHARRLTLNHPIQRRELVFSAPIPPDMRDLGGRLGLDLWRSG